MIANKEQMSDEYIAALAVVKTAVAIADKASKASMVACDVKIAAIATYDKLHKEACVCLAQAQAALDSFRAAFNTQGCVDPGLSRKRKQAISIKLFCLHG